MSVKKGTNIDEYVYVREYIKRPAYVWMVGVEIRGEGNLFLDTVSYCQLLIHDQQNIRLDLLTFVRDIE